MEPRRVRWWARGQGHCQVYRAGSRRPLLQLMTTCLVRWLGAVRLFAEGATVSSY